MEKQKFYEDKTFFSKHKTKVLTSKNFCRVVTTFWLTTLGVIDKRG